MPQTHRPGAEAEVDFGDVVVRLAGEQVKCYLFAFRLSFSGKAVHRVFAVGRAGGVLRGPRARLPRAGRRARRQGPLRQPQVRGRLRCWGSPGPGWRPTGGRRSALTSIWRRSTASRASRAPTRRAAWRGRSAGSAATTWSRSRRAVAGGAERDDRRLGCATTTSAGSAAGPRTVGEYFAVEGPLLKPLPEEPFETGRWFTPRVDRFGQVTVRTNRYSVPVRLIGRQVRVLLHASELVIYDGRDRGRPA